MASLEAMTKKAEERWRESFTRGPSRTRWESLPPQVGDAAPDVELLDADGRRVRLSSFWSEGPALVMFWRHYGCGCGQDRARRLQEEHAGYVAAGARVVAVGQGDPERSRAYAEKYGLPCPMLSDPERRAFDAYGVLEGVPAQLLFDAPEDFQRREPAAVDAFQRGRREQGRPPVDNAWLLPTELVIDGSGVIRLAYRYQHCESFPDARVLEMAIRGARKA